MTAARVPFFALAGGGLVHIPLLAADDTAWDVGASRPEEVSAMVANDECLSEEGCALSALQRRQRVHTAPVREDDRSGSLSDLLRQMSELEAEGQEESPWNSSFVAELARALQDAPGTEVVDDAPPANLGGKGSLEDLMLAAINERDVEDKVAQHDMSLAQGGELPSATCKSYGCTGYSRIRKCQCNYNCEKYGDCCPDYFARCSRHGGGKIIVEKAWVALVEGQSDKKFPKLLCNVVMHFTKGAYCHNGIIFQGVVAKRHGFFFLEYGNSGFVDLLTGEKVWGVQITPVGERFLHKPVHARRLHGPDFSARLSSIVEVIRNEPYTISLPAAFELLNRKVRGGFAKHLWCSDFVGEVLVGMGCLPNSAPAWNTQPQDFSSKSWPQFLHWTCRAEPDAVFETAGYK